MLCTVQNKSGVIKNRKCQLCSYYEECDVCWQHTSCTFAGIASQVWSAMFSLGPNHLVLLFVLQSCSEVALACCNLRVLQVINGGLVQVLKVGVLERLLCLHANSMTHKLSMD